MFRLCQTKEILKNYKMPPGLAADFFKRQPTAEREMVSDFLFWPVANGKGCIHNRQQYVEQYLIKHVPGNPTKHQRFDFMPLPEIHITDKGNGKCNKP
jgi:hypothetical protein